MIKNYRPGEWKIDVWYELVYDDGHNSGFGFPCKENGEVLPMKNPAAYDNLKWCKDHPEKFVRVGEVVRFSREYKEPASGTCRCGERVELFDQYYGACECPKCGRWYNLFGQELRSPDKWEMDPSEEEVAW